MKTRIMSAPELLRQVSDVLAGKHTSPLEALDEIAALLSGHRHYDWTGIYLSAGTGGARVAASSSETEAASRHITPIKLASRTLGAVEVRSSRVNAFSYQDRVLLKQIAAKLARYLVTKGKPLMRKLRAAAEEEAAREESSGKRKPASEAAATAQRAAGATARA